MWWFNRNTGARRNSRRRDQLTGSDRLERLEIRQVLSAVTGGANQYDGSQFLVQFRDEQAIQPLAGTAIGGAVEGLPGWYTVNVLSSQSVGEARAAYQVHGNVASTRVAEKVGMTYERDYTDEFGPCMIYSASLGAAA